MARYLIVAHQTAGSPELLERVKALAAADPAAEFTLLVPATPTGHLLHNWEEGEARQLARKRAAEAMAALGAAGVPVAEARVGSHSPLEAVGDELQAHPATTGSCCRPSPRGCPAGSRATSRRSSSAGLGCPLTT